MTEFIKDNWLFCIVISPSVLAGIYLIWFTIVSIVGSILEHLCGR